MQFFTSVATILITKQGHTLVKQFVLHVRSDSFGIGQLFVVLFDFVKDHRVGVAQVTKTLAERNVTTS